MSNNYKLPLVILSVMAFFIFLFSFRLGENRGKQAVIKEQEEAQQEEADNQENERKCTELFNTTCSRRIEESSATDLFKCKTLKDQKSFCPSDGAENIKEEIDSLSFPSMCHKNILELNLADVAECLSVEL